MKFFNLALIVIFGAVALLGIYFAIAKGAYQQLWIAIPSIAMAVTLSLCTFDNYDND